MRTSRSLRIISLSILPIFLSCAQIESVTETYPYSINAGCNTKTVNDGNLTYWADGDEMAVLFSGDNSCYGKFTRKEDNRFSGEFNLPAGSGDWYGVYPYSSKSTTPSAVSITVPTSSTQNGNDSRAHLAGSGFPLYGCAKDVEQGKMPTIPMRQALTVVRFVITNTEAEPLIVKSLEFTAPTDIAGEFTTDLTAEEITWTKVSSKTSNTIRLDVTDATAIANGEAADFYIGMIPFTASGKATLKVSGVSNEVNVSSTVEFSKNFNYIAGAINKLRYNYVRTAIGGNTPEGPTTQKCYVKQTSAPSDWSGKYLIVHTSSSYAFATYTGYPSGYRQSVTIDKNGKILSNESSDKCAFTIKKTTTSGQYNIINSEGKYVSSNKSSINIGSSGTNSISFSNGQVTISNGDYKLRYSESNNKFQYSNQWSSTIDLYKLSEGGSEGEIPDESKNKEVYNLESEILRSYLDRAESSYAENDTQWSTSVLYNISFTAKGGAGYDFPEPVSLSWLGYEGSRKTVTIYNNESRTDEETSVTTTDSTADIYNLIPGRTYYYSVVSGGSEIARGSFATEGRRRMMKISDTVSENNANNCRDFGGLPTTDSKTLKYGKIFRGTNLDNISDEEKQYMIDYMNIRADIDLRMKSNTSSSSYSHQNFTNPPVFYSNYGFDSFSALQGKEGIKKTFEDIMNTVVNGGAVYIHCKSGADRTGYISMLLEAVLGVTMKAISIDYEITSLSVAGSSKRDRTGNREHPTYIHDGMNYIRDYSSNGSFQENATQILIDAGINATLIQEFQSVMIEQ